jgi:anti-sigma factor RsiW
MNTNDQEATAQQRFELLSAYIDQEVNASEKLQVEQWLKSDSSYHHQYQQLLQVKKLLLDLPAPNSECQVNKVITKITLRSQRKIAVGITAIALVIASFGSAFTAYRWKVAEDSSREEQLILAMEEPIVPMPESLQR